MVIGCVMGMLGAALGEPAGPTVSLSYQDNATELNKATDFLYFVPVISMTAVDCSASEENSQTSRITDYHKTRQGDQFTVECRFEMRGRGWHKNRYDPASLIAWLSRDKESGDLKNLLEYIAFEGEGLGRVEVIGRLVGDQAEVEAVRVHFNADGHASPVRAGLYSVKRKDGGYRYENRYDPQVVRINTLEFQRSEGTPKMAVSVASVVAAGKSEGLWGRIKGAIANLFIPPVEIAEQGQEAMLDFGKALHDQAPTFTFPKAKNLIESGPTTADAATTAPKQS